MTAASKPAAPWDDAVIAAINVLDAGDKLDEKVGVLAMLDEDGRGAPSKALRQALDDVTAETTYLRRRLAVIDDAIKARRSKHGWD